MSVETKRFQEVLADLVSIRDDVLIARNLKGRIDELVSLAQRDIECREFYLDQFRDLLDEGFQGPWELLPYAMYRLKWPEVLARAQEFLKRQEMQGGPPKSYQRYLESVVEAFEDSWVDADLWE